MLTLLNLSRSIGVSNDPDEECWSSASQINCVKDGDCSWLALRDMAHLLGIGDSLGSGE
jgi:hypothetical protein